MAAKGETDLTPWRNGRFDASQGAPRLLFRRMFEDWAVELAAFRGRRRVVCIASGGCTAIALANSGFDVTAIDINPAQIDYVRARLAGDRRPDSASEQVVRSRRSMLHWLGVSSRLVREFLTCESPRHQLELWDRIWSYRMRIAARLALHPWAFRLAYDRRFIRVLPPRFDLVLAERIRRGLAIHPNKDNPFMWQMFQGSRPEHLDPMASSGTRIKLVCDDIVEFLNGMEPGQFDAFSLSNILDGCGKQYKRAVARAVRRAAVPNAIVILRTFAEPVDRGSDCRDLDRSHLWGSIVVEAIDTGAGVRTGRFGHPLHVRDMRADHVSAA